MTIKVKIKRPLFRTAQPGYGARLYNFTPPPSERTFIDTLAECAGRQDVAPLKNQHVHRAPSPIQPRLQPRIEKEKSADEKIQKASREQTPGALPKLFSWLRTKYAQRPVKKLRVAETVSLGEKRFVAILQVDDRKYLIGGGGSNVALLTALDAEAPQLPLAIEPTPVAAEPVRIAKSRIRGIY